MISRRPLAISALVIALMLAVSLWAAPRLHGPVASHWGFDDRPDGFVDGATALLLFPTLALGLAAIFALAPLVMPRAAPLARSASPYATVWVGVLVLLLVIHTAMLAQAGGRPMPMARITPFALGALFAVIGNALPKVRYNYFMGVRTPWTLADERVWDRTHRFVGPLMLVFAVVLMLLALTAPPGWLGAATPICLVTPAVIGAIYSYIVARRQGLV